MIRWSTVLITFLVLFVKSVPAEFADYVYTPATKDLLDIMVASRYPLPKAVAGELLKRPMPERMFDTFAGKSTKLQTQANTGPAQQVAIGQAVGLDAAALFGIPIVEGGRYRWLTRLVSHEALALRLRVDLTGFLPGQALYLIDSEGLRTFGPFTQAQAREQGNWLPTVMGDNVVLLLESDKDSLPPLYIEGYAHFFDLFTQEKAAASCPEPADCETDPVAQQVSTAVAMLYVPQGLGAVQCSGTLLNRSGTPTFDPLFITAHHCFEDGDVNPADVEVFWDYRTGVCDPDAEKPKLNDLERSYGAEMLGFSARLDGHFLRLDQVPVGKYGRAWAGWDSRTPVVGDKVQGFHLPAKTPMKTCRGTVIGVERTECLGLVCATRYEMQTQVRWNEGITEGGSSGSGLFFRDLNYRLEGMLSNGPTHTCGKPEGNLDNFASFTEFYPIIACHLVDGASCSKSDKAGCLFSKSLGSEHPLTKALRNFRDDFLAKFSWGQTISQAYYKISVPLARHGGVFGERKLNP